MKLIILRDHSSKEVHYLQYDDSNIYDKTQ